MTLDFKETLFLETDSLQSYIGNKVGFFHGEPIAPAFRPTAPFRELPAVWIDGAVFSRRGATGELRLFVKES